MACGEDSAEKDSVPFNSFNSKKGSVPFNSSPQGIVDDLRRIAVVVSPTDTPRVVPTDPDDDHVIAAAVSGQADLIASGDKRDLLPLGSFQGIEIVTAREAVERLGATGKT